jgi:hypothetical protein
LGKFWILKEEKAITTGFADIPRFNKTKGQWAQFFHMTYSG